MAAQARRVESAPGIEQIRAERRRNAKRLGGGRPVRPQMRHEHDCPRRTGPDCGDDRPAGGAGTKHSTRLLLVTKQGGQGFHPDGVLLDEVHTPARLQRCRRVRAPRRPCRPARSVPPRWPAARPRPRTARLATTIRCGEGPGTALHRHTHRFPVPRQRVPADEASRRTAGGAQRRGTPPHRRPLRSSEPKPLCIVCNRC